MLTFITLGLAVLLIALNALFVAAEFSFVKIRSTRMEILARGGNKRAKAALFGLAHLNSYLSVCQLGITLSSLGLGWLGEPVAAAILSPLFTLLGLKSPELIRSLSFIFGFSLITFGHVVFGELVPKTISIRAAEATVLLLARPMMAFYFLFLPAIKLLDTAAELAIRLMGGASLARDPAHSPDELKLIVAEARAKGLLDADEARFVDNIFNLERRNARDLMVHRTRVAAISAGETVAAAIEALKNQGFSRLPVYDGERDNMVGFIHAKDLLGQPSESPLSGFIRPAPAIFDHSPADEVLARMRGEGQHFGLVWDEYGSWQGLITLEDLLETIVGEIKDEFDRPRPRISPQGHGVFLVAPAVSPNELAAHMHLDLGPDAPEHYHTLAALLDGRFVGAPAPGASLNLYGAEFSIFKTEGSAIKWFMARPGPAAPEARAES